LSGFPGDVGRDGEKGYPGLPAPKGNFLRAVDVTYFVLFV